MTKIDTGSPCPLTQSQKMKLRVRQDQLALNNQRVDVIWNRHISAVRP